MWYPVIPPPPSVEPVTLDEAKAQLGVQDEDHDALIARLISAARAYCEAYTGLLLAQRELTLRCDGFADFSRLPVAPVTNVSAITYVAANGTSEALEDSIYEVRVDGLQTAIVLKPGQTWPIIEAGSRVSVALTAGAAPEDVRHAILLLVGQNFEQRENGKAESWSAADCLLANHRFYP